jgi:hypothetical protein
MYVKSHNGIIEKYPYTFEDFRQENPYTNPANSILTEIFIGTDENKKGFVLSEVSQKTPPAFDSKTQTMKLVEIPVFENGQWVLDWIISEKTQDELNAEKAQLAKNIRDQRNQLLSSTDWTQLADSPGDKAAWAAYRQALRDIPAQAGFPWEVTWPKRPV